MNELHLLLFSRAVFLCDLLLFCLILQLFITAHWAALTECSALLLMRLTLNSSRLLTFFFFFRFFCHSQFTSELNFSPFSFCYHSIQQEWIWRHLCHHQFCDDISIFIIYISIWLLLLLHFCCCCFCCLVPSDFSFTLPIIPRLWFFLFFRLLSLHFFHFIHSSCHFVPLLLAPVASGRLNLKAGNSSSTSLHFFRHSTALTVC